MQMIQMEKQAIEEEKFRLAEQHERQALEEEMHAQMREELLNNGKGKMLQEAEDRLQALREEVS